MKQWRKYHGDQTDYRNRAEERRRTVGSTAFVSPHRPVIQQPAVVPTAQNGWISSGASRDNTTVIPGYASIPPPPMPPMPAPPAMPPAPPAPPVPAAPSIGEMLLAKDRWLRKHDLDDVDVVGHASSNRGGLGFQSADGSFLRQFVKKS